MNYTLLGVVQSYLDRTSGFYVNSIFESDESQQIAHIAEEVFYDLEGYYRDSEFTSQLVTLDHVGDTSKPNYLQLPSDVQRVRGSKLSYLVNNKYNELIYLSPEAFLEYLDHQLDGTLEVTDFSGVKFSIREDKAPTYFTSFDGRYLVTDSYDSSVDTTLMASKTRAYCTVYSTFLIQDDFQIPLPQHLQALFRDMVLVECYSALREELAPPSVQRRVRAGILRLQQKGQRIGSASQLKKNYGRR